MVHYYTPATPSWYVMMRPGCDINRYQQSATKQSNRCQQTNRRHSILHLRTTKTPAIPKRQRYPKSNCRTPGRRLVRDCSLVSQTISYSYHNPTAQQYIGAVIAHGYLTQKNAEFKINPTRPCLLCPSSPLQSCPMSEVLRKRRLPMVLLAPSPHPRPRPPSPLHVATAPSAVYNNSKATRTDTMHVLYSHTNRTAVQYRCAMLHRAKRTTALLK